MKKISVGVLLLIAMSLACSALAENIVKSQPDRSLQLTIKSDKKIYAVGEPINIEYKLENISGKNLIVETKNTYTHNILAYVNGSLIIGVESIREVPRRDAFSTLSKNEFLNKTIDLTNPDNLTGKSYAGWNKEFNLLNKPGTYSIYLIYKNDLNVYDIGNGRTIKQIEAWTGTITSNTISIKVIEKTDNNSIQRTFPAAK